MIQAVSKCHPRIQIANIIAQIALRKLLDMKGNRLI